MAAILLLMAGSVPCEENDPKTTLYQSWSLEAGQIVSGEFATPVNYNTFDHFWITMVRGDIGLKTTISDRLQTYLEVEGKMWYNTFPSWIVYSQFEMNFRSQYWSFYLNRAAGIYTPFGKDDRRLEIEFGLFPFKYDKEVRNLGEYLFRGGTYPAYLINEFDRPWAELTGIRVSSTLFDNLLRQDFLLTTETEIQPFFDFTPTYIVSCDIKKMVDFGFGVSWAHLISVNEKLTTPHNSSNTYVTNIDTLKGQGPGR